MKLRLIIPAGILLALVITAFLLLTPSEVEKTVLKQTQLTLQKQGFKTDLTQFDLSISPEMRQRAITLTNAVYTQTTTRVSGSLPTPFSHLRLTSLEFITSNSAAVIWRRNELKTTYSLDGWESVAASLAEYPELDGVVEALTHGPIGFDLEPKQGMAMLLPHLATLRNLSDALATRAMVRLRAGNTPAAWRDLVACSRLATAWSPEPADVSHSVRFACARTACNAIWQALQTNVWTDQQLLEMQREWEVVDFFRSLSETASFTGAAMGDTCRRDRQEPLRLEFGFGLLEAVRHPGLVWGSVAAYYGRIQYRLSGSYEDQSSLLLHSRDRELQLRSAIVRSNWAEMRAMPGVTNAQPWTSKHTSSGVSALLNSRQLRDSFRGSGKGLLAQAAEAETQRRLLITALALERYRLKNGAYPSSLKDLVPFQLVSVPIDFMDGQPLRYQVARNAFLVYSVGLDCSDDGGRTHLPATGRIPGWGIQEKADLLWPMAASDSEIALREHEKRQKDEEAAQLAKEEAAQSELETESRRVAVIARLEALHAGGEPPRNPKDLKYRGKLLPELLQSKNTSGTRLSLLELLSLKRLTTGQEPELATFEVPASYQAVTNLGTLHLAVDPNPDEEGEAFGGGEQELTQATNGHCLLTWNTTYAPPGKHYLQAVLVFEATDDRDITVCGPLTPFYSSNLFQYSPLGNVLTEKGAFFHAKLAQPVGTYSIEFKSLEGRHLKTLSGTTSNGVVDAHWDLVDDRGERYTNDSIQSVFSTKFPDPPTNAAGR